MLTDICQVLCMLLQGMSLDATMVSLEGSFTYGQVRCQNKVKILPSTLGQMVIHLIKTASQSRRLACRCLHVSRVP